ncbi:MAG TPA: DUF192 domain-containing protein [Thermoanaerobaculia bacterium]|jgi:hypothetical protein
MRFAAVMLMLFACDQSAPPAQQPSATTEEPPSTQTTVYSGPRVIFPDGTAISVEIAADDELRAQGLMFRDRLRPNAGMLFMFAEDDEHAFWMKNTLIPLDMIWIDANQKVVAVKYNVPPCKVEDCPSYPPGVLSRYVLEVAGGVAQAHGVKAGDQLRFEQTESVVVRP